LKKTPAKKKTTAKKIAVKKTVAAKTTAPKTAKVEVTKTDLDDKYVSYIEDVRGYDKDADVTVCETMQKDRMKSRVTFYYLVAKNEGKLAAL